MRSKNMKLSTFPEIGFYAQTNNIILGLVGHVNLSLISIDISMSRYQLWYYLQEGKRAIFIIFMIVKQFDKDSDIA